MEIACSDIALSRATKEGTYGNVISNEQYAKLVEIGAAFRAATRNECFDLSEEIETVKIEAAYINGDSQMTAIKFQITFNPFLGFGKPLSTATITLSALWEISRQNLWYVNWAIDSKMSFPRDSGKKFDLEIADGPEKIADYLLQALAKTVDDASDPLDCEKERLQEVAKRIERLKKK